MLNAGSRIDLSSQSDPESCLSTNIHLDWTLDFEKKSIFGSATHSMTIIHDGCTTMSFDSNGLIIEPQVEILTESSGRDATNVEISVGQNGPLGEQITISIPEGLRKIGSEFRVRFVYKTGPNASAVQWLDAASTAGKQRPYVFTQCQAIHARSLLPCMDSPGVKTTYSATVRCPLWCTVLMSALLEGEPIERFTDEVDGGFTTFHFRQPVPTCAYLIALAAGRLESRDISSRVRVWSEPEVVEQAAFEFAETESFLKVAEDLTIPYVWGRYDVLCLPPSFPYGGMENPCITFATPTLLAGDRSLADVIAHEIAHSWTGNLVTNVTWEHFWLNEGWTVWLERKIMSRYKGNVDYLKLSAQIGWKHLEDDIAHFGSDNGFTNLVWPLSGEDPDDAFSGVPYEKGFNLLMFLEGMVGTTEFEAFAKNYIDTFKFKTVSSEDFRKFFMQTFSAGPSADIVKAIDWDEIFYRPGLPRHIPDFSNSLSSESELYAAEWISVESGTESSLECAPDSKPISHWSSQQTCIFLELLIRKSPISESTLRRLDQAYGFTQSKNSEIRFRWQSICLKSNVAWIVPSVVEFLGSQGRMKFVRPLYRALAALKEGSEVAKKTFLELHSIYHPIARKMVAQDLGVAL